jgi:NAD(P)-dependent dehydrogenase (short-subunit alcohol dehydrogenase family)
MPLVSPISLADEGRAMKRLKGKVAVITGGGRGIGRGISKRFAQEGAKVVIAQRDPETGKRTCQEIQALGGVALFVATDVAKRDLVQHMVDETIKQFATIDVLVNNAAITGENGPFLEVAQEVWDRVIEVNLTGTFICSQLVARVMAHGEGGSIVNISSINAFRPAPRCSAYATAKGGLETLTRSMAVDLAPFSIRVNCIWPGGIQTRLPDDVPAQQTDSTLLGRVGLPSDIAAAAAFLASSDASFITGQSIGLDAGSLINTWKLYGRERPRTARA